MSSHSVSPYRRSLTPIERLFTRSPFSIVTMVARIQGHVTESLVREAISKVRSRHPNLRARIVEDNQRTAWLTSDGVGEIPVTTVPRRSDDHWIDVVQQSCPIPFDFAARPAIRFFLLHSAATSDLVILCHHILCDGMSLAYLARDLMVHLGDPARAAQPLSDPVPMDRDNVPAGVSVNALVRFVINRMNKKWAAEKVVFDQEDYQALNSAYWTRYPHQVLSVELTEGQTSALVERCRSHDVTVNSALCTAFTGASAVVQGEKPFHSSVAVAASLRDRLPLNPGEAMGFYAGMVRPNFKYNRVHSFWDNSRQFHSTVRPLITDKNLFQPPLLWCYLDPTILEAMNFKKLGGLVPGQAARHPKLSAFHVRADTVLSILKREKMASLDRVTMGTAVTNLGRLDFPRRYGSLELERLIMKPGAGFPLVTVNLVLGAVTCARRLSLVVEFVEDNVSMRTAEQVTDRALQLLAEP